MIYTLTVNPSLDYIVDVTNLEIGKVNRTQSERIIAGGKGLNVSTMLKNLGIESTALGFIAGFTGTEIERQISQSGIITNFIHLDQGSSRINVKLRSDTETEVNGQGPVIPAQKLQELFTKLDVLQKDDILVLAGSIPNTLPSTLYSDIMKRLCDKGVLFAVDATKDLLLKTLEYKPFVIKPNNHELSEIFGVNLNTREEVVPYAKKLIEKGAQNVLVSMGSQGAVLVCDDGSVYMSAAPKIKAVYTVGAGDSMVAGFIAGWTQTKDYQTALKMGLSSGSATASQEGFGSKEDVELLFNNL